MARGWRQGAGGRMVSLPLAAVLLALVSACSAHNTLFLRSPSCLGRSGSRAAPGASCGLLGSPKTLRLRGGDDEDPLFDQTSRSGCPD
eukprot:1221979-Rhodomonas_salina.1